MYSYTDFDEAFVRERAAQFRAQVDRRIDGSLTEDEFKPLRLMNGLYLQLHAYMLRVAIPYGTLNSRQMRQLAMIAERWDRGYGHFTTRQNIQFNWPRLRDVPDMIDALADVGMHAIQTSGNTIRNVTADHFAGAAADEIADPRPVAELLRQWSTDHPEFQFLPRKFKIAVTGAEADRAVIKAHDIGLQIVRKDGQIGYRVIIGGGLGRTPMIGKVVRDFLPKADLLPYAEAIVRVYNQLGRRDNKYKARIKITVHENGIETIRDMVEAEFAVTRGSFGGADQALLRGIEAQFAPPRFATRSTEAYEAAYGTDPVFRAWVDTNVAAHRAEGYGIVTISLKAHGATPGDATADQMRVMADMAETYGHDELRISHEQNVILPHVHRGDLPAIHARLKGAGLATANLGLISDIIACPGMDYCALATARSIPVAQKIATRFDALKLEHEIGALKIKISGCINACGHHHVGHIGILGLDRAGVESYQITLGGDGTETATIGERAGPGFAYDEIVPAIERLIHAYLDLRDGPEETFLDAYRRLGAAPFKAALYPEAAQQDAA
ncbi:nitrite/sulfite reductase hemoprotein beta-component ferrodoxin domain protein [Dinoroseobacter shibae DFL 12 = DSM 16493]|jgi:sulfite reductase (NADPH) hemoprotein beta-component|uniref:Nitrite/sulfite reductase hemoprotein beta-component ferrodoxin domain protein n=1 Tax=Dinoroseobacter shibae (strain DSM 16493 / NCIMB 14021 / DFL 12) TaxID=398580 RepID=A8LHU8_DINSH|nr:nitrite/sulfite reductase [Dinoroseobacter shibae]ABV92895.1 nitrite/sulfite reductase hemoprotein beta-component ferrodoxin domain protein [Dinoroseobacter shibae DFL 12 = DSM 16493]URF47831.1 nitrite/sulfite reductase [Dinoroseobacter shibae]URF52140.1 nitrite/sulfite reductase [Dinoroseobacter shibae]